MTAPRAGQRYEPQLDGLRAFAVVAVAWSHWAPYHELGIPFDFGVHLFFVISGYLITRILLDVREQPHRGHGIAVFYLRRFLRIFPAYYMTLALAIAGGVEAIRLTWPWHATYLSNVWIFAHSDWADRAAHFWSLSVEEQFYLAWPCLMIFLPAALLVPLISAAIVCAPVFRSWMFALGHAREFTVVLTPAALDCLGAGALLAVARWRQRDAPAGRPLTWIASTCAAGSAIALAMWPSSTTLWIIRQTVAASVFAWMVWRASDGFGGLAKRMLEAAPVRYLGRISYGFYLIHNFAFGMFAWFAVRIGFDPLAVPGRIRIPLLYMLTFGLAAASWHVLEKPLNDLKRLIPYRERSVTPDAHVRLSTSS